MSDTEIRMMRYTIEQLSAELQATRQYVSDIKSELERTRKALNHCIRIFRQLEDVLDEKASLRDFDDPDLYAWAVRIKPIWLELKEITGIDYKTALEQKDVK